jgi:hypothetical protein
MFPVAVAVGLAATFSWDPMEAEQIRLLNMQLARFPSKNTTEAYLILNHKHQEWLDWQIQVSPTKELIEWRDECLACEYSWMCLYVPQNGKNHLSIRLEGLENLRNQLGGFAFAQGAMPPPVPINRFREGKPPLWTLSALPPQGRRNLNLITQ